MASLEYKDLEQWSFKLGFNTRAVGRELLKRGWTINLFEQNQERKWAYFIAEKDDRTELLASLKFELFTNLNGRVGYFITTNKSRTYNYAKQFGIRVPQTKAITDNQTSIGEYSNWSGLVVKPENGSSGRGITVNVKNDEELVKAITEASKVDANVVVQEYIAGEDYRFLFLDYKLVAVVRRAPASVVGDGISTVSELIKQKNSVPRTPDFSGTLSEIKEIEVERLFGKALLDSVPEANQEVVVSDKSNISQGGEAHDVTDEVHQDYEKVLSPAIRSLGLRVCGVDIITPDVSASPQSNACLIELNSAPNIRPHIYPKTGKSRDIATMITDMIEKG